VVGGVEHLHERDKVEEDGGYGGGNGNVTPAGPVVEGRRQDSKRGDAVKEDRDSKPKKRHGIDSSLWEQTNLQYIGCEGEDRLESV